jgi:hypothetical protein
MAITNPVIMQVEGIDQVVRNLRRHRGVTAAKIARGIYKAGAFLLAESQLIVPVQLGDLRGSGYVRNIGDNGANVDVVVGYTKEYAVYVHEDLVTAAPPARAAHGRWFNIKHAATILRHIAAGTSTARSGWFWRGEREQAKFLETPMRTKRDDMFQIIANEARK